MAASTTGNDMETYEWKQWIGFKRLHAVKWWERIDNYISICGISQPFGFIEPPITQIKCKNCERKLNGK